MTRLCVSIIGVAITFIFQMNISSAQESFVIADGSSTPIPVVSISKPALSSLRCLNSAAKVSKNLHMV